jgi:transposase
MTRNDTGISNRQTPADEERERQQHPPAGGESPLPEDVAGRAGDEQTDEVPNRQTAHKAGVRSIAQKESKARYPDRSMPPTRKKAGAFGKEPPERTR